MVQNHPVDPRPGEPKAEGGPHPAVSLIVGFALIILLATVVHVVFKVLV
jgi:hypothetical protein